MTISDEERSAIELTIAARAELDSVRGTINSFARHELVTLFVSRGMDIPAAIEEARRWQVNMKFELAEKGNHHE